MVALVLAAPVAYVMVERARGISFLDPEEGSFAWRLKVWPETFTLIKDHPLFGIGKGSEGKLRDQWGLYDNGKLPPGHFHSTPIQIAVWWGLLALLLYYAMMAIFAVEMWRLVKRLRHDGRWELWGVALGGLGGLVAFNISSLVHFNFGDGEVVMMPNVTIAQSAILSALDVQGLRDTIVMTDLDFPSVRYAYAELAERFGARIVSVPSDDGISIDTGRLLRAIDERTRLVAI